jgi:hypothetical protein
MAARRRPGKQARQLLLQKAVRLAAAAWGVFLGSTGDLR